MGALLLPATVQAQDSDEVLLSNTGQEWDDGAGTNVSSTVVFGQGFTTGSNADGYHLSSIELNVERLPNTTADVTIALWSATSDSRPDASVATLTHSTGTWATGFNTFDAPADTELDTGTTYFVHMSYSGSGMGLNLNVTNSTSADAGGAPDWSVGQNFFRVSGGDWRTTSVRFRFKINGRAAEGTPTTGICDRTQQVRDAIVGLIPSVSNCADVTATHLAGIDDFSPLLLPYAGLTALKAGDFDGLTALTVLWLPANGLTELPAGVFDDLTALETLFLGENSLATLPAGVFDKLTALTWLQLQDNNDLTTLPDDVFDKLTALTVLELANIGLISLPAGVFDNNTALERLYLGNNGLTSLPAGVFNELIALSWLGLTNNSLTELPPRVFDNNTALERLELGHNALTALPDGVFSGLTSLTNLSLGGNSTDPMQLTVTMEKVGTDQARAKVLAGAPFAVDIPVTLVDGTLDGGATTLRVETGSVEGTAVTVTRTAGTTAAVTVDVDLTTQPVLPSDHQGYAFARASSGLPATVLPVYTARPTVESVAVKSAPQQSSDTYGWGETIVFTLTFSEKVRVTGLPQPKLAFDLGGSTREARYVLCPVRFCNKCKGA